MERDDHQSTAGLLSICWSVSPISITSLFTFVDTLDNGHIGQWTFSSLMFSTGTPLFLVGVTHHSLVFVKDAQK